MVTTELDNGNILIVSFSRKDIDGKDVHCLTVGQFSTSTVLLFGVGDFLPESEESLAVGFGVDIGDVERIPVKRKWR